VVTSERSKYANHVLSEAERSARCYRLPAFKMCLAVFAGLSGDEAGGVPAFLLRGAGRPAGHPVEGLQPTGHLAVSRLRLILGYSHDVHAQSFASALASWSTLLRVPTMHALLCTQAPAQVLRQPAQPGVSEGRRGAADQGGDRHVLRGGRVRRLRVGLHLRRPRRKLASGVQLPYVRAVQPSLQHPASSWEHAFLRLSTACSNNPIHSLQAL